MICDLYSFGHYFEDFLPVSISYVVLAGFDVALGDLVVEGLKVHGVLDVLHR